MCFVTSWVRLITDETLFSGNPVAGMPPRAGSPLRNRLFLSKHADVTGMGRREENAMQYDYTDGDYVGQYETREKHENRKRRRDD